MNHPNDPTVPPSDTSAHGEPRDPKGAPVKVKRRRRWPFVILGLLVALLLLVLMAPKIASTAAARNYVLGKVNATINGTVEVRDWSLSWTGGIDVHGVRVLDAEKRLVAEIAHVRTDLTLMDAARGRYRCGTTTVDDANLAQLIIRPDGTTNLDDLVKKRAPGEAPSQAPAPSNPSAERPKATAAASADKSGSPLPEVSGDFTLNRPRMMVLDQRSNQTVFLDPASAVHVKVTSLDEPITNAISAVFRVGSNGAPGTVKLDGSARIAKGGRIDIDNATADETLALTAVPLQSANAFLALAGQKLTLAGTANGAVSVKMNGSSQLTADGDITASQFAVSGEPLSGETYASSVLKIPVKITRTAVNAQATQLKIEALGVETDHLSLAVTGDVAQEALVRALGNRPPAGDGHLAMVLRVPNVKGLADQMPRTMHVRDGVKIASGSIYHETNVYLKGGHTVAHLQTDIQDVTGTNDGQPVKLAPISQTADVTLPDVSDVAVHLGSAFATIEGGGKTLAAMNVNGKVDLPAARKELGQFIDFGKVELAGTGQFTVRTSGDPAQAAAPIRADASANFTNLKIAGIEGRKPIDEPTVVVNAGGTIRRGADNAVSAVEDVKADGKASFVSFTVKDGRLRMGGNEALSIWEMLESADVEARVELPKANAYFAAAAAVEPLPIQLAQADPTLDPATPRGKSGKTQAARRADAPVSPVPVTAATTTAAGGATTQPLPPLKVTDGFATLRLNVSRNAGKTLLKNGALVVERLAFTRGAASYAAPKERPRTVDLKLEGVIDAAAELRGLTLATLDGVIAGGTLKAVSPINVTGLGAKDAMKATGEVQLAGRLVDVTAILDALDAKQPGESYPYSGDYQLTQKLATENDVVGLAGSATVANFRVETPGDPSKPVFSEQKLSMTNALRYDGVKKNASFDTLKLDMESSDALHLALVGNVLDVGKEQRLDGVKLTLVYDLEKVWPIIGPMLPETQKDLREAKTTGKYTRVIDVAGKYPAGKPFSEAVRSLVANGGFAIGTFDAMGVNLANFDLKFAAKNGVLTTDGPPAEFNKGKLNFAGLSADLTGDEVRLTSTRDLKLIEHATINPLLGDTLGKYVNPVFTNSKRADGLLAFTITRCEGVALGEGMRGKNSGDATVQFELKDMDIANPLGSLVVGSLLKGIGGGSDIVTGILGAVSGGKKDAGGGIALAPGEADTFDGEMTGTITLKAGETTQDVKLSLVDPAAPTSTAAKKSRRGAPQAAAAVEPKPMVLAFKGNVRLSDLKQNLDVSFPAPLLAKFIPEKNVSKWVIDAFPNGVPLALKGHTNKPEVDAAGFVKLAGEKLPQLIGGSLGGGGGDEKGKDPIGGLLDSLGKKKAKDRD